MKKILILGGGFSKERAISLDTAKSVLKALKKKNYKAIICEPDGNLIKKKHQKKFSKNPELVSQKELISYGILVLIFNYPHHPQVSKELSCLKFLPNLISKVELQLQS